MTIKSKKKDTKMATKSLSAKETKKIKTWILKNKKSISYPDRISEFMCGGYTLHVYYVKNLSDIPGYVIDAENENEMGVYYPALNLIFIATESYGQLVCEDAVFQTLLHEFVHVTSYVTNKPALYVDEDYTDMMAQLILQFLKTRK